MIIEKWVNIDFVKWFGLLVLPKRKYEVNQFGYIRSLFSGCSKFMYHVGCFRETWSNGSGYRYITVRFSDKKYQLSIAKAVYFAFSKPFDVACYDIVYLDKNPLNCEFSNLALVLHKKNTPIPDDLMKLFRSYAEGGNLYKIIGSLIFDSHIDFHAIYSKDDLLQDFYFYLFENLGYYVAREYSSFERFCFVKANDFLTIVKRRFSRSREMAYIDDLYIENDEGSPCSDKSTLEDRAILVSEFSMRMAHGVERS